MVRNFSLSVLLVALASCASSPKIDSLYDKDADFSRFETFSFATTRSETSAKYSSLLDKFMKAAITGEMTARGYKKADTPDLLINFHISSKEKTEVYNVPPSPSYYRYRYYYGYGAWPYYTTETRVKQYTEGTVNIDLVDSSKNQLVWEGIAVGRVREDAMENLEARVNDVVKLIFQKYPFVAGKAEAVMTNKD